MANRRNFLLGIGAALAAPAIVRAESLMKVAQLRQPLGYLKVHEIVTSTVDHVLMREVTFRDGKQLWMVGDRIIRILVDDPRPFVLSTVPLERPNDQAS